MMETDWRLARAFLQDHPYEAGLVLEKFAPSQSAEFLHEVPVAMAAAVLEQMSSSTGAAVLSGYPAEHAAGLGEALSIDTTARLLRYLGQEDRERWLAVLAEGRALPLRRLLNYPLGTAGSLMDPQVLALPESLSVGDARERLQRSPQHSLYYLYLLDAEQRLTGVLNLRELMLADFAQPLSAVMRSPVQKLSSNAPFASVLIHPGWREYHALPVTDHEERFLGAIRYKTLKRLEQESSRTKPANESMTALLSLGELCWIGFGGMLAGLAATVFPPTLTSSKGGNSRDGVD
jgi:magnesium transporter